MKNYPLFIALCASCALIGSVLQAEEQVQPKVVRVGEKAPAQNLDAQAEQQPLRAKVDKRDLFDYLDKNYGATQQKAESAPVEAEELQQAAPKIVKVQKPQAAVPEVESIDEAQEEELPPVKEEKRPWQIKVAEPSVQQQVQQPAPAIKQLEPIRLVEKKAVPTVQGAQAKMFVLKGFEPPAVTANNSGKTVEIKLDNLNDQQKSEVDALVQAEAKAQQQVAIPVAQPQQPMQQPKLQPLPQQIAKPAEPSPSIFGKLAPAEGQSVSSEQKRYPLMNRELLEAKKVAPVVPSAPVAPVVEQPKQVAVQAPEPVQAPALAKQDKITLVEVPSGVANEVPAQRVRAPEMGNEMATTRDLNLKMLEAPSAPSQVTLVNKPAMVKQSQKVVAAPKKEAVEENNEEVMEEKEAPKKNVSSEVASSDERVVRSTFTSRVNGLEPADSISSANPNSRKLYYFSEIAGMSGKRVTHRWEQNGKVLVEKQMTVGSNKWRLWSSATPKSGDKNDVTVSVVDGKGNILKTETLGIAK